MPRLGHSLLGNLYSKPVRETADVELDAYVIMEATQMETAVFRTFADKSSACGCWRRPPGRSTDGL